MTDIRIFDSPEFGIIRSVDIEGEPWFVGRDIAEALGYQDQTNAMKQHCRGVVNYHPIRDSLGRTQEARVLSEPDVYRLVVHSKLPGAERFERWVFEEVLPAIRRRGGYMTAQHDETPEQTLARAVLIAQDTIARQDERIAELEPMARFGSLLTQSTTDILVRDLAKLITQQGYVIGERRLFQWLRESGYLVSGNSRDYNHPRQRYMEQGLFNVKANTFTNNHGEVKTTYTPLITPKGQEYFLGKFGLELERSY